MPRRSKQIKKKEGLAPGTLIYTGEQRVESPELSLWTYSQAKFDEKSSISLSHLPSDGKVTETAWVNLVGLHDVRLIESLGAQYNIHPLILEDILNTTQRPKIEEYDGCLFIVIQSLHFNLERSKIESENISLVLKDGLLLSFQEVAADNFNPVRERIRRGKGKIRVGGADYLLYALLDSIVDHYLFVVESIGERIGELEDQLLKIPEVGIAHEISRLRSELFVLRRRILPLRDVFREINREEFDLIQENNLIFYRDVADHLTQVLESLDTYREILAASMDLYLSSVSNKMNDVMKFLTMFASIFIPLTFIAGIYGMNFEHMPELQWKESYFVIWGIMILVAVGMLIYFRKKKWI